MLTKLFFVRAANGHEAGVRFYHGSLTMAQQRKRELEKLNPQLTFKLGEMIEQS